MLTSRRSSALSRVLGAALLAPVLLAANPASADPGDQAVILVAAPALRDPDYRQSVVVATGIEGDRHIGVIVNRPTRRTLSSLFPEHEPSKKVIEPVYFGGPMSRGAVVAVVRTDKDPGRGSIGLTKEMYLAMTVNIVDKVIEDAPNTARYYVGYIVWRPGELRLELDRKIWHVVNADPDIVFRKETAGLWEEMMRLARSVTAQAPVLPRAIGTIPPATAIKPVSFQPSR